MLLLLSMPEKARNVSRASTAIFKILQKAIRWCLALMLHLMHLLCSSVYRHSLFQAPDDFLAQSGSWVIERVLNQIHSFIISKCGQVPPHVNVFSVII